MTRRARSGRARIAFAVVRWGALGLAVGRSRDNSANATSAKASAPQATTR